VQVVKAIMVDVDQWEGVIAENASVAVDTVGEIPKMSRCHKAVDASGCHKDFRSSKYFEGRSAAYYWVSEELAAQKNVDMERGKRELEEHQSACASRR